MSEASSILYLTHKEIDKQKWDHCIQYASNGLIYGFSYYLDKMCPGWDGIVLGDYKAVMPLPVRKKYGIAYIFQPAFCAQLGVFGNEQDEEIFNDFLKAIPSKFKYLDLVFNYGNVFTTEYPLFIRKNFVLELNRSYEAISSNYRENTRRNIKKAINSGCTVRKDINVDDVIQLAISHTVGTKKEDLNRLKELYQYLKLEQRAICYGVYTYTGKLVASCIFFLSGERAYYILVGNDPNGKKLGASHLLINGFIKDHLSSKLLLDFEGSDIDNLAFFYSGFGAKEENYTALKLNRFPWYLRWLK